MLLDLLSLRAWYVGALTLALATPLCVPSEAVAQSSKRQPPQSAEPAGSETRNQQAPVAVVELFTSQGCSSCPPADKLLAEIDAHAQAKKLPVYVLSMHVDYWNSLGWSDPYSAKAFSDRQRRYATARQSRRIYTPQMIVNGGEGFTGSNGKAAQQAITQALGQASTSRVKLKVKPSSTSWQIDYTITDAQKNDELVLCLVADAGANQVPRGENSGRKLAHVGVVRTLERKAIGDKPQGTATLKWSPAETAGVSVVAFIQDGKSMAIRGATRWQAGG